MIDPVERAKRLPCWQTAVTPIPLSGGLSNHNFVVEDAGERFVVRIGGDQAMHNVLRFNEQSAGRAASAIGITPKQVYAEPEALVIGFIEGETFGPQQASANIERIVSQLKILHEQGTKAIRGPVLGFSVFHVHRHYAKMLQEAGARVISDLPKLLSMSEGLQACVGPIDVALCHNDLLAANFIDDGEKIWIVDWEHAGFGSPLFDLANIASNSVFDEAVERRMLQTYFAEPASDDTWRRYKALRAASHLREAMWSMIAEIYSEIDEDYVAYTKKNLDDFEQAHEAFRRS